MYFPAAAFPIWNSSVRWAAQTGKMNGRSGPSGLEGVGEELHIHEQETEVKSIADSVEGRVGSQLGRIAKPGCYRAAKARHRGPGVVILSADLVIERGPDRISPGDLIDLRGQELAPAFEKAEVCRERLAL